MTQYWYRTEWESLIYETFSYHTQNMKFVFLSSTYFTTKNLSFLLLLWNHHPRRESFSRLFISMQGNRQKKVHQAYLNYLKRRFLSYKKMSSELDFLRHIKYFLSHKCEIGSRRTYVLAYYTFFIKTQANCETILRNKPQHSFSVRYFISLSHPWLTISHSSHTTNKSWVRKNLFQLSKHKYYLVKISSTAKIWTDTVPLVPLCLIRRWISSCVFIMPAYIDGCNLVGISMTWTIILLYTGWESWRRKQASG